MRLPARPLFAMLVALLLAATAPAAHALLINLHFAQPGDRSFIDSRGRFADPGTALRGGGSVEAVFLAAASLWEAVLHDDRVFNITVGWTTSFPSGVVAAAMPGTDGFNEIALSTRTAHFADPTPLVDEEFGGFAQTLADLGGGSIVTGRHFSEGPEALLGFDLLTTALHEIGHVLGNPFDRVGTGREFVITDGPFAGTRLPCDSDFGQCGHLSFSLPGALMNPAAGLFQRTMISDADLLFVAQDGGFRDVDFGTAAGVPLPGTLALALAALLLLPARCRRRLH